MNRQERRKLGQRGPSGLGHADSIPSTVNVHGVCRSCSERTFLWLPGRICTGCVDRALRVAEEQSVDAMLAYLEDLEEREMEAADV